MSFFLFNIFTCNILMVYYVDNMLLWYQLVSLQPSLKKNGIRFLFTTVGILSCQNNIFLFWLKIITKFRFLYVQNEDRPEPHALWVSHWLQILLGRLVLISQTGYARVMVIFSRSHPFYIHDSSPNINSICIPVYTESWYVTFCNLYCILLQTGVCLMIKTDMFFSVQMVE